MAKEDFKKGEIVIYKTPRNGMHLRVRFKNEDIWLTQDQIALLFGTQRPAITKHLKNIFQSQELKKRVVSIDLWEQTPRLQANLLRCKNGLSVLG